MTDKTKTERRGWVRKDRTILRERTHEALSSVLPVSIIMLLLFVTIAPVGGNVLMMFLAGAVLLVVGMGLFTLGAELSMMPMGEAVGAHATGAKKLWPALVTCLFVGVLVTISEPDLQVLAEQVPMIPNLTLILTVALGVGIFLAVAFLRIAWGIRLRYLLVGFYAAVFVLAQFVPREFLPVAFDSGGVTTGPMTVPFIMALGLGISAMRSDGKAEEDSFGLVALASVGPILAVLILGIIFRGGETAYTVVEIPNIATSRDLIMVFLRALPQYFKEVALALAPIVVYFAVLQATALKLSRRRVFRMAVGFAYTFLGLALFLTGVNVGFMPAGYQLGKVLGALSYRWILLPVGMLVGYFIVSAEPAVYVLNKQVEELTSGAIPQRAMSLSLSIGVCASVGLAMLRVLTGMPIMWLLIPGYALSLLLAFIVPDMFTGVAFDSGGVASGPMTATFLLPFAIGACEAVGGDIVSDAFGIVAMVAMTPLVTIQALGVYYQWKLNRAPKKQAVTTVVSDDEIIDV